MPSPSPATAAFDLTGRLALITGSSAGIGFALARGLAQAGATIVLNARSQDKLEAAARTLRGEGATVHVKAFDVTDAKAVSAAVDDIEKNIGAIDILINNAGFGTHQYFLEQPWDKVREQLQLNMISLTELSHRFGGAMARRGRGHLLNVASIGAYTPCPTYATYSAGKAYVRDFTEAIAHELAPRGVRVCCLCPGGTESEFHQVAGQTVPGWMRSVAFMSADKCARIGLRALLGWRRNVVSGISNKIGMWFLRFIPRRMIVWIGARSMGQPRLAAPAAPAPKLDA